MADMERWIDYRSLTHKSVTKEFYKYTHVKIRREVANSQLTKQCKQCKYERLLCNDLV